MRLTSLLLPITLSLGTATAVAQEMFIPFTERTSLDEAGFHVVALMQRPMEQLKLPAVDTSLGFLQIFYSKDVEGNEIVSALVLPTSGGQVFYIDLNNDEDLTNDGDPLFFPFGENELTFYLHSKQDPQQRTGRIVQRTPRFVLEDSAEAVRFRRIVIDEQGNLQPPQVMLWQAYNPGMTGARHTFFFDDRLDLARGKVEIDGVEYAIGIHDYDQNGRFDDVTHAQRPEAADRLMIDLGRDGQLSSRTTTEIFKLNDIFEVGGKRFKLQNIDPYGRGVTLVQTDEAPTAYFVNELEASIEEMGGVSRGRLDEEFWDLMLPTIRGNVISMADLRGRHILLNFWGEWCAPCIAEIPALVAVRKKWPENDLFMIGMLFSSDLEAAEAVVQQNGMGWPQVILTDALQQQFKVQGYPMNILVLPDGETFLQTAAVSQGFFDRNMQ